MVAQETVSIRLADENAEVDAVPIRTDVGIPAPEMDTLSHIIATFHDIWGNCHWTDEDKWKSKLPICRIWCLLLHTNRVIALDSYILNDEEGHILLDYIT